VIIELEPNIERLERMKPLDRAKAAAELVDHHRAATQKFADVRAAAIAEAYDDGLTLAEIAAHLGISAGRVHQLLNWKGTTT
jgi:DNA-directed RNA polymerase specialized sigma24 family protein